MSIWLLPVFEKFLLRAKRKDFFDAILWAISMPPGEIDKKMGQDINFFPPSKDGLVIDPIMGNLIMHVYPTFHGKEYHYWYSIWQIGLSLKIGVVLEGDLKIAPIMEGQNEIEKIWGKTFPEVHDRDGSSMYQWSFEDKDLFVNWINRERFILGMRHCHFRMLRILSDGTLVGDDSD